MSSKSRQVMKKVLAIGIGIINIGLLAGCATEGQLAGIAAKAKIPQECRLIGQTPQISAISGKKNLDKVVEAMGGGNVIVETGAHFYQGLMALANTWWGNLYDCDKPTLYHGDGIRVLSPHAAHPVNAQIKEASDGVRVTSNTDTVRGCTFIVNVNDLTAGELTQGPYTVRQTVLKYNTATLGGNTVLLSSDPHTGEAYKCATQPAALPN
jgi:hypothetical protein